MNALAYTMECHRLCEMFPEMPDAEFQALKADIAENGQREAIWVWRNAILEGRARYRACRELGIEPRFQTWEGEDGPDLVAFVMSLNYHRRHLTAGQKAMIATVAEEQFAAELKRRRKERARERADAKKRGEEIDSHNLTRMDYERADSKAAELVGTNATYVNTAKRIKAEAPDLAVKVKNGQMTIPQADREIKRIAKRRVLEDKSALYELRESDPWQIIEGDCLGAMDATEAGTVRLVFADPPYNIGVNYGEHYDDSRPFDEYQAWCRDWMTAVGRLLTWDGSFFLLVNHEWAPFLCADAVELGFRFHQWITWYESFGVNCSGKYNRCSRALIWFTRHRVSFAWNPEAVNRPSDRQLKYNDSRADPNGKTWDDVWGINPPIPRVVGTAKERVPDFPTQLPLALLRPIVAAHSDPGDLVLDPFSGSGTTGCACVELGRRFIGVELCPAFAELSRRRLLVHSKEAPCYSNAN